MVIVRADSELIEFRNGRDYKETSTRVRFIEAGYPGELFG